MEVKIFGEPYDVKARVAVLNGFSAHADCDELDATVRQQAEGRFPGHGHERIAAPGRVEVQGTDGGGPEKPPPSQHGRTSHLRRISECVA